MTAEITNLETELNYLNSFKTYCNFSDLRTPGLADKEMGGCGVVVSGGTPHMCAHAHTCTYACV